MFLQQVISIHLYSSLFSSFSVSSCHFFRISVRYLIYTIQDAGNTKGGDSTLESGKKMPQITIWHVIAQPRILMLCLAASIRHCGKFAECSVVSRLG